MTPETRYRACIEVSWEIANAVGGIHTVIASKARQMRQAYRDHYLVIGPWLREPPHSIHQDRVWEDHALDPAAMRALGRVSEDRGIACRTGRWLVPGRPSGILVDFSRLWVDKDRLLADYWERFGLDSLHGARDYEEPVLFGVAAGEVAHRLSELWLLPAGHDVVLHAHEWLSGSAILKIKHTCPEVATVFTTHATALGRSLASRSHLPEEGFSEDEAARLARDCGVAAKHSMEIVSARVADVFTTVSQLTALECERVLGRKPEVVLPNALESDYPPKELRLPEARRQARRTILELASRTTGSSYSTDGMDEPIILVVSGRYEFRNKGMDIVTEALGVVQAKLGEARLPRVVAFYLVPADSEAHAPNREREARRLTHALRSGDSDPLLDSFDRAQLFNEIHSSVHAVWVPKFLDGTDSRVPEAYFQLLAGADMTFFPSWYEPWGYTPMESAALGIPTVTSDLSGFAEWASGFGNEEATGVFRVLRRGRTHREAVMQTAELVFRALRQGRAGLARYEAAALELSRKGTWSTAIDHYLEAHDQAVASVQEKRIRVYGPATVDAAYFSMEFAIIPGLQIYSGGLGVLAGDFLKGARDLGHSVCGLGLAYREGYFKQRITDERVQEALPAEHASFERNGLRHVTDARGQPLVFDVPLPGGRRILSGAWRLELGSSQLFLLDTDLEANPPELRALVSRLYTVDRRERWMQEYFLGTGGIRLLDLLGIRPRWIQMNEGHTSLLAFERIGALIRDRHLCFDEALAQLRERTLFTTHTPVPAGHEEFELETSGPELDLIASRLRVHPDRVSGLGKTRRRERDLFSLTALALSVCSKVNAVSKRHRLAAEHSFEGLMLEHKYLFSVTNGVHPQTWVSPDWQALLMACLGPDWPRTAGDPEAWKKIQGLKGRVVWECHRAAKSALIERLVRYSSDRKGALARSRREAVEQVARRLRNGETLLAAFARRFTAYKRPDLVFQDPDRLAAILARFPDTVFVFAGKAHPADFAGQQLIHEVLERESEPRFRGHVLFLEDYGMTDAQLLVSGADLWLNFPEQPLEASGTSGMKAAMNGVLNLSVNDGWVCEASANEVPWKIGTGTQTLDKRSMDWIHAQEFYALLELEVLPEFWKRDAAGLPTGWIARMKRSVASAIPRFSAQRMVQEYADRLEWWLR